MNEQQPVSAMTGQADTPGGTMEKQQMVRVTYIEASGDEHVVDAETGLSLMQGAMRNDVPGILADCGGSCACGLLRTATCSARAIASCWRSLTCSSESRGALAIPVEAP